MLEMNEAFTARARHRRVDLGNNAAGNAQNGRCEVDGHTKADIASGIGRGHLEQSYIDRQTSARQECRHLLKRNRYVVELTALGEALYIAADEKVLWRWELPVFGGSAEVVMKLTNSRSGGPGCIASSPASRLRGAAHPVPR